MNNKDQCAICGREAGMSLTNTGEIYCENCFNRVLSDPILRKKRAKIGRGGERRLVRDGLSIGLVDEAEKKRKDISRKIPSNFLPFRNEEFNLEFYYPGNWNVNLEFPMSLIALFAPREILKGDFNANLTVSGRVLSGYLDIEEYPKADVDNIKRLLTNQGVQKFKMMKEKQFKIHAEWPARQLIYGGTVVQLGMKFNLVWVSLTLLIDPVEYMFTLTSDKNDHKNLLEILEQIIETVRPMEQF